MTNKFQSDHRISSNRHNRTSIHTYHTSTRPTNYHYHTQYSITSSLSLQTFVLVSIFFVLHKFLRPTDTMRICCICITYLCFYNYTVYVKQSNHMVYQTTQQQRTYLMPRAARAKTVLARGFSSCISTRPRFIGKSQVVVRPHVDCMYISTSMPATTHTTVLLNNV